MIGRLVHATLYYLGTQNRARAPRGDRGFIAGAATDPPTPHVLTCTIG